MTNPLFSFIKEYAESIREKYLRLWSDVCLFEATARDKETLDRQIRFLQTFAEQEGFDVVRYPFPRSGDCLTVKLKGTEKEKVLMMAHMDTVHSPGVFGDPAVRIEGDWIYGPGVIDCKGGAVEALMILDILKHAASEFGLGIPTVKLVLTADEEISGMLSGKEGLDFIRDQARGADYAFNMETGRTGKCAVGRKGICRVIVKIHGISGHAGNAYFQASSAIKEAAHKLLRIESLSEPDGCTFNCGKILGGDKTNIIPDYCELHFDVRFKTVAAKNTALEKIREVLAVPDIPGTTCESEIISYRPPMECTEGTLKLLEKINATAEKIGTGPLEGTVKGGGSDAAYLVELGIPTVCSLGPCGFDEHSPQEKGDIPSLTERAILLSCCVLDK